MLWISYSLSDVGMISFVMIHGWLALTITNSPFWVGATVGVNGIGLCISSMFSGVLVDRLDRRKLVIASLIIQALTAFLLAVLIFSDMVRLWHILLVGFLDGGMTSVKRPSQMALTLDVVGREKLLSATAAHNFAMTVMGILCPLIGGVIISQLGIQWAYIVIGLAFIFSSLVIPQITIRNQNNNTLLSTPWQDMRLGIRYVFSTPIVRSLIILAIIAETFAWSHEVMLPVMARDVFDIGASGLGYLLSIASAGAALSMFVVSNIGNPKGKEKLLIFSYGLFGLFLILFAASPWITIAMALLALAYASAQVYETALSTILQTVVHDSMRGRVLSFQVFTWGLTGIGGFYVGAIAEVVGAPSAIMIGGGIAFSVALLLIKKTYIFRDSVAVKHNE